MLRHLTAFTRAWAATTVVAAVVLSAVVAPAQAAPASRMRAACHARPGYMSCLTLYKPQTAVNRVIAAGRGGLAAQPKGWGARAIESAYKLPVSRNPHQAIAVVDAQSTPHLAADLAFYRHHYGLLPCTVKSGCLRIVNQAGHAGPLPKPDPLGWGVEETLDVSMVSAACPDCRIVLVEARSPSFANMAAAENTAARLGSVVSNSFGSSEGGVQQTFARAYDHPGHAIVVSSGDDGFGAASSPANLSTVTAVGGTQLARASNARGWTERVWNAGGGGSGSGCSAYVPKPSWQHDPHCPGRTTADVAALAWNIAIYDTSLRRFGGPWVTIGGTSAAAPIIAGIYGLAGNAARTTSRYPYQHRAHLFDITTGNNAVFSSPAAQCGGDYFCAAKPGYDAPTGLGTPDGTAGF